jgi:putative iron-regulated protein
MKLGLMLRDPEEEHDCFSDNPHNLHFYNAKGIRNVYLGHYKRVDGRVVNGPSLSSLVRVKSLNLDAEMMDKLDANMSAMSQWVQAEEDGEAYDQMLAEGNTRGNARVLAAIDALFAQTKSIEKVVAALQLKIIVFEGSDSSDSPKAVFR